MKPAAKALGGSPVPLSLFHRDSRSRGTEFPASLRRASISRSASSVERENPTSLRYAALHYEQRCQGRVAPPVIIIGRIRGQSVLRPVAMPALVPAYHRFGIGEAIVVKLVAKILLREFATGRMRKRFDKFNCIGKPPFRYPASEVPQHLLGAEIAPGIAHDQQQRALVPLRVRHADRRGLSHARASDGRIF